MKDKIICERCGSKRGIAHTTVDESTDKIYGWSLCNVCNDDING